MSFYLKDSDTLWPMEDDRGSRRNTLPVGTYTVGAHPTRGFYLKSINDFDIRGKIYGKTTMQADRILRTFADRPNSTGVLLNGEKGSGKTMLAKLISQKAAETGIPTLVINTPFTGDPFNTFIQSIDEPCIIVFDEFEKVFDPKEQEETLTLLDGVYPSKKLFILTCNDYLRVNTHLTNRPGRIFYNLEFGGLDLEFIKEYCVDNLINQSHIPQLCRLTQVFSVFNFDMLKALVEEMNRYNESPQDALEMLNAKPFTGRDYTKYNVHVTVDGAELGNSTVQPNTVTGNPMTHAELDFWLDTDPTDDDADTLSFALAAKDLQKIDPTSGTYLYVTKHDDKDVRVTLTRQEEKSSYDWRSV